jgi:nucleotide-binding universal stress UspA family protein
MRIVICSNGMPAADQAARIGAALAGAVSAETTLLGIAEKPVDEAPLRLALETEAQDFHARGVEPRIVVRAGDPVSQILAETASADYDLAVIGAERKGPTGLYWRSQKTYEVIKVIPPPVLVAIGDCKQMKKFLVCTGGKKYIAAALQLTGQMAAALGAEVTLLHVMAEPPAMYSNLVRLEEDLDALLQSGSELGLNLSRQKKDLEALGVRTEVRVRHGLVLEQVMTEARTGGYDLLVTGSSSARGIVRHYIMGDLTRTILNRSECSVLVARTGPIDGPRNIFQSLKRLFVVSHD